MLKYLTFKVRESICFVSFRQASLAGSSRNTSSATARYCLTVTSMFSSWASGRSSALRVDRRDLGITQKSAWFLMHRIRLAMQTGTFEKLGGQVEADETFIGGKARFMHMNKRAEKITGTGGMGKVAVMGLLERHGEVRVKVVPDRRRKKLHTEVKENVESGSELFTDALESYKGLDEYVHQVIDHAEKYVDGQIHANGLENFWSLLKRCLKGTYVSVEPYHLFRYLDEESFISIQRPKGYRSDSVSCAVEVDRWTQAGLQAVDRKRNSVRTYTFSSSRVMCSINCAPLRT